MQLLSTQVRCVFKILRDVFRKEITLIRGTFPLSQNNGWFDWYTTDVSTVHSRRWAKNSWWIQEVLNPVIITLYSNWMVRIWWPRVGLNLLYLQVEKRKKISTRCPEKSRFKKDFFWWPVCTSAFLGQNQRLSGFWVLLSTVHSSAVQCSARQAGQVRADCYARSAEKKRSSQFDELNTQLYVCLPLLNICAQ